LCSAFLHLHLQQTLNNVSSQTQKQEPVVNNHNTLNILGDLNLTQMTLILQKEKEALEERGSDLERIILKQEIYNSALVHQMQPLHA